MYKCVQEADLNKINKYIFIHTHLTFFEIKFLLVLRMQKLHPNCYSFEHVSALYVALVSENQVKWNLCMNLANKIFLFCFVTLSTLIQAVDLVFGPHCPRTVWCLKVHIGFKSGSWVLSRQWAVTVRVTAKEIGNGDRHNTYQPDRLRSKMTSNGIRSMPRLNPRISLVFILKFMPHPTSGPSWGNLSD